ncbi:MAG: dihydroorotase [Rhodospirillaceae bacterium]|jgi:dihydroorotase|nr:dihydroorotase [Rhodospirillaceae bacterium]|tara:strand:- start:498 stop:1790 length:1293 start_codon:yes stop_codon:yes gene_type:complete
MAPRNDTSTDQVAYVNARLLDPAAGVDATGGVLTDGEAIADAGPGVTKKKAPKDARIVDCQGKCLGPGLVDIRVELGDLAATVEAAVSGGVTSMVCLPTPELVIDDMSEVEFVARRARKLGLAKVYPYGAVTKGLEGKELAEMGLLAEAGAVAFTDGERAVADAQTMRRAMSYASTFGLMIVQHPEEPSLAADGAMNAGETATRLGLFGIPKEAEVIMVERDLRLASLTGGRLHIAHVSTAETIDALRRAKADGLNVTCDTAPPYFALNETAIGDYRTFAKLSPPLRAEQDRQAVVEGLADGTIDAIASDHTPRDEESKRLPFAQAAPGGIGLNTLLAVSLELHHNGHLSLLEVLKLVTSAPAGLMGLPAGKLEKGAPADLVLFDPDEGWKVDADKLVGKAQNSPFDRRPVQGRVLKTVIDGRLVFEPDA